MPPVYQIEGALAIVLLWAFVAWRCWPRAAYVVRVRRYNLHRPPSIPQVYPLEWMYAGNDQQAGLNADRRRATTADTDRAVSAPGGPPQFHIGLEVEWHE